MMRSREGKRGGSTDTNLWKEKLPEIKSVPKSKVSVTKTLTSVPYLSERKFLGV